LNNYLIMNSGKDIKRINILLYICINNNKINYKINRKTNKKIVNFSF